MTNSNRLKNVINTDGIPLEIGYDSSGNQKQLYLNSSVELNWNYSERLIGSSIIQRPEEEDDADYYTYDSGAMRIRKILVKMANSEIIRTEEKIYLGNYEIKRLKTINGEEESTILNRQTLRIMDGSSCAAIIYYWTQDDQQREVETADTRKIHYQIGNSLGSVSMELDENGKLISYEEYFPYGGTALIAGDNQKEVKLKEYRYSGKECDDSTGLYYYGARYYCPWLCRWLKPDCEGETDGLNLYLFVGGNPITFNDPDGSSKVKISNSNIDVSALYSNVSNYISKSEAISNKIFSAEYANSNLSNDKIINSSSIKEEKSESLLNKYADQSITSYSNLKIVSVKKNEEKEIAAEKNDIYTKIEAKEFTISKKQTSNISSNETKNVKNTKLHDLMNASIISKLEINTSNFKITNVDKSLNNIIDKNDIPNLKSSDKNILMDNKLLGGIEELIKESMITNKIAKIEKFKNSSIIKTAEKKTLWQRIGSFINKLKEILRSFFGKNKSNFKNNITTLNINQIKKYANVSKLSD